MRKRKSKKRPDSHAKIAKLAVDFFRNRPQPVSDFEAYERAAMTTHHNSPRLVINGLPIYHSMGLAGEAGEFVDKVKKAWRNRKPLDKPEAAKELGDVLWYIMACARDLGYTLEEIANLNLAKLYDRHKRGVIKGEGDNR